MKIYIVTQMCDDEYGCTEVIGVYANKADAQKYIDENQTFESVWWRDDDVPTLYLEEWDVK